MSGADLGAVFLLGLLGSTHCMGMCSGFVACLGGRGGSQALYQAGRLASYVLAGALLATLGGTARHAWDAAGGRWLLLGAGAFMGVMGIRLWMGESVALPNRMIVAPLRRLLTKRSRGSAFGLGFLTGLLPCGLLYVALLRAAASARPLEGALLMAAFWLGTAPALVGVAALMPLLRSRGPRWWPRVAGVAVIALGILTASHALPTPPPSGAPACAHCAGER